MVINGKMKRTAIITGFLFYFFLLLPGQDWLIQGTIEHGDGGEVLLAAYYGDRFSVIDSMKSADGFFYFVVPEASPAGLYRIIYSDRVEDVQTENRFVEFIFNGENMEIFVAYRERGPVPLFEHSIENHVYQQFMELELAYESELMILYNRLGPSSNDDARRLANERYRELQLHRVAFMDSLMLVHPDLYAICIMNAFRAPVIPGEMAHAERIDTLKGCFFDHASLDDPTLLHAPVYTFKLIDYLSLYRVDTLSREAQEEAFMVAVDQIMVNVSQDPELRGFVVEFLLEGFEMLDMEQVQVHIADHYLDEACESDIVELILSRMEGYKQMAAGEQAPDFVIRDTGGKNHRLSEIEADYVLVVFWASSCDHCRDLLTELQEWYLGEDNPGMEVVSISIDTSAADFEYFTGLWQVPWISTRDPLGWYGKVPSDYFVYATPSLFLLDNKRTILARPTSFRQFQRVIKKLIL